MGYQVVAITLRDGRIIEDVAIVDQSVVAAVRDQPHVSFDPADITDIAVTHRKWDFRNDRTGKDRAAI